MAEQLIEQEDTLNETQNTQSVENETSEHTVLENENAVDTNRTPKHKLSKKALVAIIAAAVAVIAIAVILLVPSKLERVQHECTQIAGMTTGSGDYFMIDTYPDDYDNIDPAVAAMFAPSTQKNALEAIKYANEALGFNGSLYYQMLETTALMGRQSAETSKYRVSWTYHPDDGLEVTYEKK